jgi:putative ABC transport system permease protein
VNGETPPGLDEPSKDVAIYFGDEHPLTWSAAVPAGSRLVGGAWWPAGYQGPPLLSVSDQLRVALGLKLGDEVVFQVFGEPVATRIASFRSYQWQRGGVNFPFVLSPGALDAFPVSHFGLIKAREGAERELQRELVETYPELVFIPIDEAIGALRGLIDAVSKAIAVVGGLAVVSGVLVLAGALATGRRQREADAVVAKVLGATRADVVRSYVIEYGLVGALSALLAALLGVCGAWAFVVVVLDSDFFADPLLLALVVVVASVLTIAVGAATTWGALSVRPARFLREE